MKLTKFHRQNIEKMIAKAGLDSQAIDITATWDSGITAEENYSKFKLLLPKAEYQKDEAEHLTRAMTKMEEENTRKEFNKRIEEIKSKSVSELTPYFREYYDNLVKFLNNQRVNGMIVVGNGGTGKSFNLITKLQEKGIGFELIKGHMTPLSFYRKLYQHREKEYLIIDDVAKLISDMDIVSLMLGACDYDNRKVEWISNSPLTSDLPSEFIFNSKIFILSNEFDSENKFLKALKDRCVFFELGFTKEQIFEMLYILAQKRGYSVEIVDYLKGLSEKSIIQNLSLRLLDKVYPYSDDKELMKTILEFDKMSDTVWQLMNSSSTVKDQVKEFFEQTGLSRATFFRIKAKVNGNGV